MSTSADANAAQITELYRTVLGRNPDPGSVDYWDSTGLSVDQVKAELEGARDAPGSAENLLFSKNQAILKDINGLAKDKQVSFADIINYAKTKNIPYANIVTALEVAIPDVTIPALQYEQDRQALSKYADAKGQVNLVDAIRAASEASVGTQNLSKFFGLTPEKLAETVENNALSLADAKLFDTVSTDAVSSLTGAKLALLNQSKTDSSIYSDLRTAKGNADNITYPQAFGVAEKYGLTDDQLAPYIGVKPADIAKYRTTTTIQNKLSDAKQSGDKLTLDEILGIQKETSYTIEDFVNSFFSDTPEQKTALLQRLAARDSLTPALKGAQDAIEGMVDTKTNAIDPNKLYDYAKANNLTAAQIAGLVNQTPEGLGNLFNEVSQRRTLNTLASDGLSYEEVLGEIGKSNLSIDDFVTKYLSPTNKEQYINELKTESSFTPAERQIREAYRGAGVKTLDAALGFASEQGLSDADAIRILGLNTDDVSGLRRNQFITQGLNQAKGTDNLLTYDEVYNYAKANNISTDELMNYISTPENRADQRKIYEAYVTETEADAKRTPAERISMQLTDLTSGGTKFGTWDRNSGWNHHLQKMTDYLTGLGVTDLRNIATKVENRETYDYVDRGEGDNVVTENVAVTTPHVIYYDKTSGKELQAVDQRYSNGAWEFGSEGSGKGSTGYFLAPAQGGVGVTSQWREKYGVKEYALPVAMIAAFAAPYLLPELIGTATGLTAAEAASLGLSGGTGLAGALNAAGLSVSAANLTAAAIVNGVYNGTVTEAAGGDFEKGFISGVAPVVGSIAADYAISNGFSNMTARAVGSAVSQLVANGSINLNSLTVQTLSPEITKQIVEATNGAITANQAKFLLTTALTGGDNIPSLAKLTSNPGAVFNFVNDNRGLIDEIASGKVGSQLSSKLNVGSLTDDQQTFFADLANNDNIQVAGLRVDPELMEAQAKLEAMSAAAEVIGEKMKTMDDAAIRQIAEAGGLKLSDEITDAERTQVAWLQVLPVAARVGAWAVGTPVGQRVTAAAADLIIHGLAYLGLSDAMPTEQEILEKIYKGKTNPNFKFPDQVVMTNVPQQQADAQVTVTSQKIQEFKDWTPYNDFVQQIKTQQSQQAQQSQQSQASQVSAAVSAASGQTGVVAQINAANNVAYVVTNSGQLVQVPATNAAGAQLTIGSQVVVSKPAAPSGSPATSPAAGPSTSGLASLNVAGGPSPAIATVGPGAGITAGGGPGATIGTPGTPTGTVGPSGGGGPGATIGTPGTPGGIVGPGGGVGPSATVGPGGGGPGVTVGPGGGVGPGSGVSPGGGGGPGLVVGPGDGTPVGPGGITGPSTFVVTPSGGVGPGVLVTPSGGPSGVTPGGDVGPGVYVSPGGGPGVPVGGGPGLTLGPGQGGPGFTVGPGVTTPTATPVTPAATPSAPGGSPVGPGGVTRPSIPGFYLPTGGSQQTQYIDYDQPTVGAPLLPEYYGLAAPDYLRPTDIGPFGLEAIIGALNATQQGNGSNQSQQNAAGQGQAAKG